MKLDALEHPKTLDLASRLEVSLPTTIGHLELLWAFTGKYAPAGDIGRHSDGAIARACHWTGRPELFTLALRESGFIDADSTYRLTIHDWHDHAPRWVKSKLKSMCQTFITGSASEDVSEDTGEEVSEDSKGSEAKRSEENTAAPPVPGLNRDAWRKWLAYRKSSGKPIKKASETEAAKKMAALLNRQLEAVDHSIANGYQGLYLPKDVPHGAPRPDQDARNRDGWTQRAARIGFRGPRDDEALTAYIAAVEDAEDKRRKGGPVSAAVLLAQRGAA